MIRIGIVDDHAIVRTGLRETLAEEVDFRVCAEGASGREALEIARAGGIDVLVMDLALPDQSGVEVLAAIKARWPGLPVLILSGFPEAHYATALLRQGAGGYLSKDCDPQQIAGAIRSLALGRRYITPAVAELLADGMAAGREGLPHDALSEREMQVFLRLAKGETVGDIARGMCLSVKTVSTYRSRVIEKLKLRTNSELTYYAMSNGLMQ